MFDYVDRDLLWLKLEKIYGTNGHLLSALKALYRNVTALNVNQFLLDWFEVRSGVKQGCILSPTLFLTILLGD